MKLHTLPKVIQSKKKRLGRGHGSGRGKTSGRGTKGQKARETVRLGFEGGQLRLLKRLPLLRGMGKNKSFKVGPVIVNVKYLNHLPPHTKVDAATLIHYRIVKQDEVNAWGIKILGDGTLTTPLEVQLPTSKRAKKIIEKAGGKVIALHKDSDGQSKHVS